MLGKGAAADDSPVGRQSAATLPDALEQRRGDIIDGAPKLRIGSPRQMRAQCGQHHPSAEPAALEIAIPFGE